MEEVVGQDRRRRRNPRPAQDLLYRHVPRRPWGPRPVSDVDGTYNGFAQEGKLHHTDGVYYDDYSMWDTFRAVHSTHGPSSTPKLEEKHGPVLRPSKASRAASLPIFPAWNSFTSEMIGDHASAIMADALAKGLTHFDIESAYRLVRQNAMETPPYADYKNGPPAAARSTPIQSTVMCRSKIWSRMPSIRVSRSRAPWEYAYDDSKCGRNGSIPSAKSEDAAMFRKRSESWRNVIDPATKFARGPPRRRHLGLALRPQQSPTTTSPKAFPGSTPSSCPRTYPA